MDLRRLIEKAPEAVRSAIKYHRYTKGSNIIYPHDKNLYLYLLLDGKAEVYQYTAGGMFISLYRYSKNSCFGEIELFCPDRLSFGVAAVENCEVAVLTKETVLLWASSDKEFCSFLLESVSCKIAESSDAYIRNSSMTLKERLLYCLYRHSQTGTLDTLSKEAVASEICASERSLNRTIAECRKEGIIDYQKHRFYILDMEMLKKNIQSLY